MARYIVHHDGWFFEWSTVSDRPRTFGMRRPEFEAWHLVEYGRAESAGLAARLDRAVRIGSSVLDDEWSAEVAVNPNRAGYDETTLTLPEIVQIYCVERREPLPGEGREDPEDDAPEPVRISRP